MYSVQEQRIDSRCRQAASQIAAAVHRLREPFRDNTLRWLEDCVAHPIQDVDEDLARFFHGLNPGMRESTMSSLQIVMEEAVRLFGS